MKNETRAKVVMAAAALAGAGFCNSAHSAIVLSSIYADGGISSSASGTFVSASPYFSADYIQLYNNGSLATTLGGLYLEESGFATEPIGLNSLNAAALPSTATVAAGGYYLIQIPNGSKAAAGQYTAPTPDLVFTATSSSAAGSFFSAPYYKAGKFGLVSGDSSAGTITDYVGYGPGLASGSYAGANTSFTSNNSFSAVPGYLGTDYAGYGTGYTGGAFNGVGALVRTNPTTSYSFVGGSTSSPATNEDNNNDYAYQTTFTLTNSLGQSVTTAAVPEPATLGIIAASGALLIARRRNRS